MMAFRCLKKLLSESGCTKNNSCAHKPVLNKQNAMQQKTLAIDVVIEIRNHFDVNIVVAVNFNVFA